MRPLILDLLFKDDRMFVLEVTPVTTRSLTSSATEKREWAVVTRRNVAGYPPFRSDSFPSRDQALAYFNRIVVETPRVSLGNKSPDSPPSLEDYAAWLKSENLFDPILNAGALRPDT